MKRSKRALALFVSSSLVWRAGVRASRCATECTATAKRNRRLRLRRSLQRESTQGGGATVARRAGRLVAPIATVPGTRWLRRFLAAATYSDASRGRQSGG